MGMNYRHEQESEKEQRVSKHKSAPALVTDVDLRLEQGQQETGNSMALRGFCKLALRQAGVDGKESPGCDVESWAGDYVPGQ